MSKQIWNISSESAKRTGIPRYSESKFISFNSYSDISVSFLDSNTSVILSASSGALIVTVSSLPEHFNTLDKLPKFMPNVMLRSHRYLLNPSAFSCTATNETWLVSIACNDMPLDEQSHDASVTKSLMASKIFFSNEPCDNWASNILDSGNKQAWTVWADDDVTDDDQQVRSGEKIVYLMTRGCRKTRKVSWLNANERLIETKKKGEQRLNEKIGNLRERVKV